MISGQLNPQQLAEAQAMLQSLDLPPKNAVACYGVLPGTALSPQPDAISAIRPRRTAQHGHPGNAARGKCSESCRVFWRSVRCPDRMP